MPMRSGCRQRGRRGWLAIAILAAAALQGACVAAEWTGSQREQFAQAYAEAKRGDLNWKRDATGLREYPLYPYLEGAWLMHGVANAKASMVRAYLARYGNLIPGQELRRAWLSQLAGRHHWRQYLAFYVPGLGEAYECDALHAEAEQGRPLSHSRRFALLWRKPRLPEQCDALMDLARRQGFLTPSRLWARIERARRGGAVDTVVQTAAWLPSGQQPSAQRLVLAMRDPEAALAQAASWPDTLHAREALEAALDRRARDDADAAYAAWQVLQHRFSLGIRQRDRINATLALYAATSLAPGSQRALATLPSTAQTPLTREWRVRVALARGDWAGVLDAIEAMPLPQRRQHEWRYFEARALAKLGRNIQARSRWRRLARSPTYYGFLAADRLRRPYALCPNDPPVRSSARTAIEADPGMQRAFEWFALDRLAHARREWDAALQGLDDAQRYAAAELAHRRGWIDRPIFLLDHGPNLRDYQLRFPVIHRRLVLQDAKRAGIDPAWVYATIRTESAWISDARSGAGAIGLMQLLPGTAARMARQMGSSWGGAESLVNPSVNIRLGTNYLAHLAGRFGPQWLASAAYNAGPQSLQRWLAARPGQPADVFIATIPYAETRSYVESTLAFTVIYDWRLNRQPVRLEDRMPAYGASYPRVIDSTARAPVACSAADLAYQDGIPTAGPAAPSAVTPDGHAAGSDRGKVPGAIQWMRK